MTVWMALMILAQQPAAGGQDVRDQLACAPMSIAAPPVNAIRVIGSYVRGRMMFGPGEPIIISAGAKQGIQKGQVYFIRRYVHDNFTPASLDFVPVSIHTAGWVTVIDTNAELAVAQITHACDGILEGDYLEPYVDPVAPPAALGGEPDYESPARIVMADQKMQTGSAGSLMLINRGSDQDVRAGQTLTIF